MVSMVGSDAVTGKYGDQMEREIMEPKGWTNCALVIKQKTRMAGFRPIKSVHSRISVTANGQSADQALLWAELCSRHDKRVETAVELCELQLLQLRDLTRNLHSLGLHLNLFC